MNELLETEYKLSEKQQSFRKQMLNPLKFWWFTMAHVPAGWIAGMKLRSLNQHTAETSVPLKYLNKNPFKSIYFAVQSMAAELSTASLVLLHLQGIRPSIAFIIVEMKCTFPKKAVGRTYFTCSDGHKVIEAIPKCIGTGEPVLIDLTTTGKMKDGTVVAEFTFTWSLKQRSV